MPQPKQILNSCGKMLFALILSFFGLQQFINTLPNSTNDENSVLNVTDRPNTITIDTPPPDQSYPAGSSVNVSWTFDPVFPPFPVFSVSLTCSPLQITTLTTPNLSIFLPVPDNFYGSSCTIAVEATDYTLQNPINASITQQLVFNNPVQDSVFPVVSSLIPVALYTSLYNGTELGLAIANVACEYGSGGICPVPINTPFNCVVPSSYGKCNITATNPPMNYLISPAPVDFYLKYNLSFIIPVTQLRIGQPFMLFLFALPATTTLQIPIGIYCSDETIVPAQTWNVYTTITNYLTLNSTVPLGDCYFQTPDNGTFYFQATSDPVSVIGNINITTPTSGQLIPSGSDVQVQWTYEPIKIPIPFFNVSLMCLNFPSTSVIVQDTSTLFTVPNNFYGDACYFDVAALNYSTISPTNVVITFNLSFSMPTNNEVIYLNSSTIPVELVTSDGLISMPINTSYVCNSVFQSYQNFTTNQADTLTITPTQYGNCSLTTYNQPIYFVPSNVNVNFTLKYIIYFRMLPTILFLGQKFTIQISTRTTVVYAEPCDLYLYCGNNTIVPAQTWTNVSYGVNTLTLSVNIPLGDTCYFNTSSTSMYDGITSTDIPVSKVPLLIVKPENDTLTIQIDPLLVLLTSPIVDNPIGNSTVQLNCSNGVVASQIVEIGTPVAFNYPSTLYGLCNFTVNDPVFDSFVVYDLDFVYQLSFVNPPTTIYRGQYFDIYVQIAGSPSPELNSTTVYLTCDGWNGLDFSWTDVPFNTTKSLIAPSVVEPNSQCNLTTDGLVNFSQANTTVAIDYITLSFAQPTQFEYNQTGSFPVNVTTSSVPIPLGNVDVEFSCPDLTPSVLIDVQINDLYNLTYPTDGYGNCTLNVTSAGYITPAPLSINISFVLSFDNVPSPIYIGQSFNITVNSTGNPPSYLTTNLILDCPAGSVFYTWYSIPLNVPQTLDIPNNLTETFTCSLYTEEDPIYVQATSGTSLYAVQLEFTEPAPKNYFYNETVPILVIAKQFPSIQQDVNVSLSCSGAGVNATIPVVASIQLDYLVSLEAFGECILSIPEAPPGYVPLLPAAFNVIWELYISSVPQSLYITESFNISVNPMLPANLTTSTTIDMFCDNNFQQSWDSIPFNETVTLTLSSNLTAASNCVLKTATESIYVFNGVSSTFEIVNIDLVFDEPVNGSTTLIPIDLLFKVSSPVNTSIVESINATFTCNNVTETAPVLTNSLISASYSDSFYGPCSVEVTYAPQYFNLPQTSYFYLKYELTFVNLERFLMTNSFFHIYVASSAVPPNDLSNTTLLLMCNNVVIEEWPSVPLNQENILQIGNIQAANFGCYLETSGNDDYFVQAKHPVIIKSLKSPFGGPYFNVPPQEAFEFAQDVSFYDGYIEITAPNNGF